MLPGLKNLEYRGYDSAGIVTLDQDKFNIRRSLGKVANLEKILREKPVKGRIGLGHTRWATHGRPSEMNAHPHTDCKKNLVIVHNGIIENYQSLKAELKREGHQFNSETDTEVLVHLIEKYLKNNLEEALKKALKRIKGSYALGLIWKEEPEKILAARNESPLVIGMKDGEYFIASDISAILRETRKVIDLGNGEMVTLTRKGVRIKTLKGKIKIKKPRRISWNPALAEKAGYHHFMLKEIYEQPRVIEETLRGRTSEEKGEIYLEGIGLKKEELKRIGRIIITGCGTSWHAGLVGEYLIEEYSRIPVEVEYASEFRYRNPIIDKETLIIAISQSGETADTLAAVKGIEKKGAKIISICNVMDSSLTKFSDGVIFTRAGPEIGVASTKAFTTQLTMLYLISIFLGKIKNIISRQVAKRMIGELRQIPKRLEVLLKDEKRIIEIAERYYRRNNFLYLGRGKGFPIALEGALKLKEVSYIHAEGYPAAEMKHGPIALVDKNMPVVVLALRGRRYEKILSNIEEIKTRGGKLIVLATQGDKTIRRNADEVIYIPDVSVPLTPILAVVPLQLLAYHIAVKRGCSPDQPRNLAKSVTVE